MAIKKKPIRLMSKSVVPFRLSAFRPRRIGCHGDQGLSGMRRALSRKKARQQHGENAGQEYAIKSSGAADRSNRRAEAAHLVEIGEIGADQRAKAARM